MVKPDRRARLAKLDLTSTIKSCEHSFGDTTLLDVKQACRGVLTFVANCRLQLTVNEAHVFLSPDIANPTSFLYWLSPSWGVHSMFSLHCEVLQIENASISVGRISI